VYLLHDEDKVLYKFTVLKNESQLYCEPFIKRLRSNKGGQHYDTNYVQSSSTIYNVSTSYTLWHNGTSKGKIEY